MLLNRHPFTSRLPHWLVAGACQLQAVLGALCLSCNSTGGCEGYDVAGTVRVDSVRVIDTSSGLLPGLCGRATFYPDSPSAYLNASDTSNLTVGLVSRSPACTVAACAAVLGFRAGFTARAVYHKVVSGSCVGAFGVVQDSLICCDLVASRWW